jgi:hypothetical protein
MNGFQKKQRREHYRIFFGEKQEADGKHIKPVVPLPERTPILPVLLFSCSIRVND